MQRPLSLAAEWVLLFLSMGHVAAQPTSHDASRADKYKAVKAVLQQFYEHGVVPSHVEKEDYRSAVYDLINCQEYGYYIGFANENDSKSESKVNDDVADLTNLALNMVIWENDLRKLRIPEEIWRPVLEQYETDNLNLRSSANENEYKEGDFSLGLAEKLNARMAEAGRSNPKFIEEGGCGAGGADVRFKLNPPDGQLFLIPVFLYKVCQAQHLIPTDFRSCSRWKEILDDSVPSLTGDYVYLARWADGVVRCGSVSEDDFWKKNESTIVITKLRSPQCSLAW